MGKFLDFLFCLIDPSYSYSLIFFFWAISGFIIYTDIRMFEFKSLFSFSKVPLYIVLFHFYIAHTFKILSLKIPLWPTECLQTRCPFWHMDKQNFQVFEAFHIIFLFFIFRLISLLLKSTCLIISTLLHFWDLSYSPR